MMLALTASAQTIEELRGQLKENWNVKDWPATEAIARRITALPQSTTDDWRSLARVLSIQKKADDAFAVRTELVGRPGAISEDFNAICWYQIERNRPVDARPACDRAVSLKANNWAALVNLGHTWLLVGDLGRAQEWYRKTLQHIQKDEEIQQGPLEDFNLFSRNGWAMAAVPTAKRWFEQAWPTLKDLRKRRFAATNDTSTLTKSQDAMMELLALRKQVISLVGDGDEADSFLLRYSLVVSSAIRRLILQDRQPDQAIAFVEKALQAASSELPDVD
ncbi:MAG: hypothetical protein JNL19_02495 [Burkholderiales bacterium]|nr:hypothetical protein [Burkholderiales bacterium]